MNLFAEKFVFPANQQFRGDDRAFIHDAREWTKFSSLGIFDRAIKTKKEVSFLAAGKGHNLRRMTKYSSDSDNSAKRYIQISTCFVIMIFGVRYENKIISKVTRATQRHDFK